MSEHGEQRDDGVLDTEDVPALEARLATLEKQIRERRRTIVDLSANAGLLDRLPRLRRDGAESFGVGIVRGLITAVSLSFVILAIFLATGR
jgi:hypothetical protein